jgi:predicted transcriptional regulator
LPKTPVRTVFEAVLPILIDSLGQPRTAADLSAYLDVQKTQLDRWIKEATKRGLIKRLTKPTRFVAASIGQQNSLFKKEDVEHE